MAKYRGSVLGKHPAAVAAMTRPKPAQPQELANRVARAVRSRQARTRLPYPGGTPTESQPSLAIGVPPKLPAFPPGKQLNLPGVGSVTVPSKMTTVATLGGKPTRPSGGYGAATQAGTVRPTPSTVSIQQGGGPVGGQHLKLPNDYKGQTGFFQTGDGKWRFINAHGVIANYSGTVPKNARVIDNPLRSGAWDWQRATANYQALTSKPKPAAPPGAAGGGVAPNIGGVVGASVPSFDEFSKSVLGEYATSTDPLKVMFRNQYLPMLQTLYNQQYGGASTQAAGSQLPSILGDLSLTGAVSKELLDAFTGTSPLYGQLTGLRTPDLITGLTPYQAQARANSRLYDQSRGALASSLASRGLYGGGGALEYGSARNLSSLDLADLQNRLTSGTPAQEALTAQAGGVLGGMNLNVAQLLAQALKNRQLGLTVPTYGG